MASWISWAIVVALTIGVSFDTSLNLRYLLDMHVYVQGAEHFWTGNQLYDTYFPTRHEGLPFTYPPFGAVVFTPLWLLTEVIGQTATERVLTVVSVIALWLVAKAIVKATKTTLPVSVILAICMCSLTVLSTLDLGQINIVIMALVIVDVSRVFKRIPLGVLVGIAAAIKLTPLVFGLYFLILWIVRKRPQGLVGMLAGFFGATALAWVFHPGNSLTYWAQTLLSTGRIGEPWYAKNVSIQGLLARFPELSAAGTIWLVSALGVIGLTALAVFKILRDDDSLQSRLLALLMVALVSLLCSPVSWHHHWVWIGPLACILWFNGHHFFAGWALFAQTFGAFHMFITGGGGEGQELLWSPAQHLFATHYLWFSLILLAFFAFRPRRASSMSGKVGSPASVA